jgi:hypothetical protein
MCRPRKRTWRTRIASSSTDLLAPHLFILATRRVPQVSLLRPGILLAKVSVHYPTQTLRDNWACSHLIHRIPDNLFRQGM